MEQFEESASVYARLSKTVKDNFVKEREANIIAVQAAAAVAGQPVAPIAPVLGTILVCGSLGKVSDASTYEIGYNAAHLALTRGDIDGGLHLLQQAEGVLDLCTL
jgi:hypothetical protein